MLNKSLLNRLLVFYLLLGLVFFVIWSVLELVKLELVGVIVSIK